MKIKQYISAAMLALVAAGFTACDGKDEPGYSAATKPADEQRVYFASSSESILVTEEDDSFSVNLYRPEDKADSELIVQLLPSYADEADKLMFSMPADVKFEAGKAIATFEVRCDVNAMAPNKDYSVTVSIGEANANVYGVTTTVLNISHPVWSEWSLFQNDPEAGRTSLGTYILGVAYTGTWQGAAIYSRTNPIDPDEMQFRLEFPEDEENFTGYFTYLEFTTHDGGKTLEVPQQPCAIDDELLIIGAKQLNSKFEASTFDPVSGIFSFNLIYLLNDGSGRGYGPGVEYLELPGYLDTNTYEVQLSDQGQVKIDGKDYAVINFNLSEAVAYADYTLVKGTLDEAQVAEVAEAIQNPDQDIYQVERVEKSGNVTFSFATPDDYTIVAVGYKVGNDGVPEAKTTASLAFHYDTFNPYAGWTTVSENAVYTDNIVASLFGVADFAGYEVEVTVQKNDEHESLYRIVNPFSDFAEYGLGVAEFGSIEFYVADPDHVYFPLADSGILDGSDSIELMSYSYYMLMNDTPAEDIPAKYWGTFKDNKVTMGAIGVAQDSDFLASIGGSIYYCDADFALDLGSADASKPGKIAKRLGNIIKNRMTGGKLAMKPAKAYFKVKAFDGERKAGSTPVKVSSSRMSSMVRF